MNASAEPMLMIVPSVTRPHDVQGDPGAPHLAEERGLDGPLEVGRFNLPGGGERGGHGVVHPHVDGSELILDLAGGVLDGDEVGHVGGQGQAPLAVTLDLGDRRIEPGLAPGQDGHVPAVIGQGHRRRPPDPC